MAILVVNKRYGEKGVYIGRPSPLGNPFVIGEDGTRAEVIKKYKNWIDAGLAAGDPRIVNELYRLYRLSKLGDLRLQCFCAPEPCHGDVIKRILEEL